MTLSGIRTATDQRLRARRRNRNLLGIALLLALSAGTHLRAQDAPAKAPDYTRGVGWFPLSIRPYQQREVPAPSFENSQDLTALAAGGKLSLSIAQLDQAVVRNNLAVEGARFTVSLADVDLLKARAGQVPSGTAAAAIPPSLGSVSFGTGGSGNASTRARAVSIGPRGSFDPAVNFTFSLDQTTSTSNNTRVNGVAVVSTHAAAFQSGYTQAFTTGTSFSLNFNIQRGTTTSRRSRFNPSLSSNYNLGVNQQLLRGFGFGMNRRFIKIADTNRESARQYFALQMITQLVSAENQYWDLVAAREQVDTARQALTVSDQLLSDNRKQAEIGTLAPLDVVSAESEVAGRRRDLITAQTTAQLAELQLKNMLARQLTSDVAAAAVETADPLPEPRDGDQPAFEDAVTTALRNRPELLQAQDTIRNQDIAVQYTKAKLKPSLSLFAMYSSAGREGALGNALSQVWGWDFPEYAYGFSLSFPLGNRGAQADHTSALLVRRQSEASLLRTEDKIRLEVRNALIGVAQARAALAASRAAVDFNQQKLDAEQSKLRAGTSTPYNVILVQRDLLSAQLAHVQAGVGYAKALVERDRSMGVLLEKRNVDLDRAIPSPAAAANSGAAATP